MDCELLKAWLEQGLSLSEIGSLVDRDASTVGYWVQKHGLVANGQNKYSRRGALTREQLEPLINRGATLHEIAKCVGRSVATVRYWIDRHSLPKPKVARGQDVRTAIENGARTVVRRCNRHGETVFVIESNGRIRCRRCRMEHVAQWRRRAKARLVAEAGGKCQLCGYYRCQAALEFHHLDPSTKSFHLSLRGVARSIEKLRAEAAKCVLLCANCHAEVEVGYVSL